MSSENTIFVGKGAVGLSRLFAQALGPLAAGYWDKRVEQDMGYRLHHMLSACYDLLKEEQRGYHFCTFSRAFSTRNDFSVKESMRTAAAQLGGDKPERISLGAGALSYLRGLEVEMKKEGILPQDATSGDVYSVAVIFMRSLQSRMIENNETLGTYIPGKPVMGRMFADINFGM